MNSATLRADLSSTPPPMPPIQQGLVDEIAKKISDLYTLPENDRHEKAVEIYDELVIKNKPSTRESMFFLACQFTSDWKGSMSSEITQKAVNLLELAAYHGYAKAMLKLGAMYEDGQEGLNKNEHQALCYFKMAADAGLPEAMLKLGYVYEEGQLGVVQNISTAFGYFKKAADEGKLPMAMFKVACIYDVEGQWRADKAILACEYCKNAADAGYEDANWKLYECHFNDLSASWCMSEQTGTDKAKKDRAVWGYLQRAVNMEKPEAMYFMGLAYFHGKGVTQDFEKAVGYLRKGSPSQASASTLWWYRDCFKDFIKEPEIVQLVSRSAEEFNSPKDLIFWGKMHQEGVKFRGQVLVPINIEKTIECYYQALTEADWFCNRKEDIEGFIIKYSEELLKAKKEAVLRSEGGCKQLKELLKCIVDKYKDISNYYTGGRLRERAETMLAKLDEKKPAPGIWESWFARKEIQPSAKNLNSESDSSNL